MIIEIQSGSLSSRHFAGVQTLAMALSTVLLGTLSLRASFNATANAEFNDTSAEPPAIGIVHQSGSNRMIRFGQTLYRSNDVLNGD